MATQLEPYLTFDGNCAEAFKHYEKVLGGKITALMPYAGSPMANDVPPGMADRIMHATLVVDGQGLMGADAGPWKPYEGVKGISLSLGYPTLSRGREVFDGLAEGGHVVNALAKTFWAAAWGMVVDRFGVTWMVSCEKED